MTNNHQKQMAGLWLDSTEAIIVNDALLKNKDEDTAHKIKAHGNHNHGSEHSMNQAKHADTLKYFKEIADLLKDSDEIYIFGPGKIQEQFQNHLLEDSHFKNATISIDSAEKLSEASVIHKARAFFQIN